MYVYHVQFTQLKLPGTPLKMINHKMFVHSVNSNKVHISKKANFVFLLKIFLNLKNLE